LSRCSSWLRSVLAANDSGVTTIEAEAGA